MADARQEVEAEVHSNVLRFCCRSLLLNLYKDYQTQQNRCPSQQQMHESP